MNIKIYTDKIKKHTFSSSTKAILLMLICIFTLTNCKDPGVSPTTAAIQTDVTTDGPAQITDSETEPPFVPTTINIKMVGDILMHSRVSESGLKADGSYNYDHMFSNVLDEIQSADIAIANQEVMLGGTELDISGYPSFNAAFEVGDALAASGFNVVLFATNHAVDKGAIAVDNCINYLETYLPQLNYLGINKTAGDAEEIFIYEQDGVKVAILNYTYATNSSLPADREYMVNILEKERLIKDLNKANELADFVIVCPHWGPEYTHEPYANENSNLDQVNWAQLMADNGADLIIATHPHVIQPVQWITAADGSRTLCYYSIGNFISTQDQAPRMVGAMADITIETTETGEVMITDYGIIPLVTHIRSKIGLVTTYKLSDYTTALAEENEINETDDSFSLEYCKELCSQVFGELYTQE